MYANLASLKAEFGTSGGTGGGLNIDTGSIMKVLGDEGPSAGPVHAFEILNAAKCSGNHGLSLAMANMDMIDVCVMGPIRVLASITNALSTVVGAALPALPLGEIGQLLGALTGGMQSLGCINLGIMQIHVQIQGQAQVASGAITSGVGGWTSFNTDIITSGGTVSDMINNKAKLKDILAEKAKNIVANQQAWQVAKAMESQVRSSVNRMRDLVKQMDDKERQAMNTLDSILGIAQTLKTSVCNIFSLLQAFLSALQGASVSIGIQGTVVAEVVQVLQAILSAVAAFFAALQDLLNFLTSLVVEAETISVKMFENTLSLVKEKFREIGYAPVAAFGGL